MKKIRAPIISFLTHLCFCSNTTGNPKAAELIRNFVPKEVFTVFTKDELKEHQMTDSEAVALYDFFNGPPMEPRKVRPAPSHLTSCHEAQLHHNRGMTFCVTVPFPPAEYTRGSFGPFGRCLF